MDRETLELVENDMNILLPSDDCIQMVYHTNMVIPLLMHLDYPDSKVHGANMGRAWGRQDPGGPRVDPWTLLSGYPIIHMMGSDHDNHWLAVSIATIRSCIINLP